MRTKNSPWRYVWALACAGGTAVLPQPVMAQTASTDSPRVYVLAVDPTGSETGQDPAIFTVRRDRGTHLPLTVYYRLSGTASNGLDYLELPNTVVIPAGAASADIIVQPVDDDLIEGPETVVLNLVEPVCIAIWPPPPDCYLVGQPGAARAVILDNDTPANAPPVVRLYSPQDGEVFGAPADIALRAYAEDREDGYNLTVEFLANGTSLGLGTFVPALCPAPHCPFFALTWSNVPPGDYVLTAVATDSAGQQTISAPVEIKVVSVEPLPVVNIRTVQAEGREPVPMLPAFYPIIFEVSRTGPTTAPLPVHYRLGGTASNGVDYLPLPGVITIPAGAATAWLDVLPTDDELCEGDESVIVRLVPPLCAPNAACPPYVVGPNHTARGVIHDNDVCPTNQSPRVALVQPQDGDVFVAPADLRVCALAKDPDGFIRRVDFFEGNRLIGSVTNAARDTEIFCIAWTQVPDGSYVLSAVATDNAGASTRSAPVHIRVLPPPVQPVVTIVATDSVATEPGPAGVAPPDTATFMVRRDRGIHLPLTVFYSLSGTASNGVDYRALSGQVTIPVGAWEAPIVVVALGDNLAEGTETVIATIEPPICIAIWPPPPDCYLVGQPSVATAYIRDSDTQPNLPPRVGILQPQEGEVFAAPTQIEVVAEALDPDGWVEKVEFFEGTNKIGEDIILFIVPPPPGQLQRFGMVWSNVPPGRYQLTAVATDNRGATTRSAPVGIAVLGPCRVPVVTLQAIDNTAAEQDPRLDIVEDPAIFRVSRSCRTNEDLVVFYSIAGTAANGVDYAWLSGQVLIPAGAAFADIYIEVIDDTLVEGTEMVELALEPVDCLAIWPPPPDCYEMGEPSRATAYIRDNDQPANQPPRIAITSPAHGQVFEAPGPVPILALALDPDGWVPLVEFFEGTNKIGEVERLFIIPPPPGQPQRFSMVWSNVPPGRYVLTARATDNLGASSLSPPVAITVQEPSAIPVVTITAPDPYGREGTPPDPCVFRVRRSGPTNLPLNVLFAISGTASNGVDYVRLPDYVTIPAGRRCAEVVITPMDDRRPEPIETVILRLLPGAVYKVGRPEAAAAIIVDDDKPVPTTVGLADRSFHLRLNAPDGGAYRVEASTNLRDWEPIGISTARDGAVHFVDPDAASRPMRFYRVVPDFVLADEP